MHSGEPDPIFPAPRRPRKGPGKLTRRSHPDQPRHSYSMVTSSPGRNSTRSATPRPNRAGLAALENPTSEPGHHLWQERRHRLARRHVKQTPPLEEHNPMVVAWGHQDGAESNRGGPRAAQFSASVQAGTSTDHRTLIWAGGHAPFSARTGPRMGGLGSAR